MSASNSPTNPSPATIDSNPQTAAASRNPGMPPSAAQKFLQWAGGALLAVWCVWWGLNLIQNRQLGVSYGWFPPNFGIDFLWGIDWPGRIWLAGGDPYHDKTPMFSWPPMSNYPPVVFPVFAWVGLVASKQAVTIWMCALGLIAAGGAYAVWRCRRRLELEEIPLPAVVAAVLFSTPVVFSMERGNYDLITVPIVIAALALMRGASRWRDYLAGALLALAPWLKVYPLFLGIGLAGLKKWRALSGFAIAGLAVIVVIPTETARYLENNAIYLGQVKFISGTIPPNRVHPWAHSINDNWPRLWNGTPLRVLNRINPYVAAIGILAPVLAWVSLRVCRSSRREQLALPYLLWVTALATFIPPVANDYSLVFLPLAALAVCSRRDPLICTVCLAALALWWQPIALPIDGRLLIAFKVAGLLSIGVSLTRRARELCVVRSEPAAPPVPLLRTAA